MEALQLGAVQMLAPSLAKFGPLGVKEFEVFDLPYIFDDYERPAQGHQGPVGQQLLAKLEPKGIRGLAYWDNGFKSFSLNSPIKAPADLKGKKMRIQSSKVLEEQMRALGSLPQVMAFSEVYQALQTGVVDGTENPISNLYTQKMHEVQKHLTITDHGYLGYAVIVNKKFWDGLPADIRGQLEDGDGGGHRYANQIAKVENDKALDCGQEERQDDGLCADRGRARRLQEGAGAGASEDGSPHRQGNHPERLQGDRLRSRSSAVSRQPDTPGAVAPGIITGELAMINKALNHLEELLVTFLMGAATLIIFASVAHRYMAGVDVPGLQDWLLTLNFGWAQELCIIMFVWMAKFGAAYGVRTGIHVGVDVLINRLDDSMRGKFIVFGLLAGALSPASSPRSAPTSSGKTARTTPSSTSSAWNGRPLRRPDHARPRMADLDRLQRHSARLVADVLPLPAGVPCVHQAPANCRTTTTAMSTGWRTRCRRSMSIFTAWTTTCTCTTSSIPWSVTVAAVMNGATKSTPRMIPNAVRASAAMQRQGRPAMNALVIFGLLAVLMLTGMPISISLGLTVLSFLFTMTQVPLESVALKLFTGIEKFEIMAIPFFILAGNFLTHGGVAKRMINFATSMVGHWYGGLGLAGVLACALFAAVSGSSPATVVAIGSILLPAMVKAGFPEQVRGRRHRHLRRARHPDPAVHRHGHVLGGDQYLGRCPVHGRRPSRPGAGGNARRRHLVSRQEVRLPAPAQGDLGRALEGLPRVGLGPAADRRRHGRNLHRHLHADRSGGDVRGLRLHLCRFHLP